MGLPGGDSVWNHMSRARKTGKTTNGLTVIRRIKVPRIQPGDRRKAKQDSAEQLMEQIDGINQDTADLLGMDEPEHEMHWARLQALFTGPMTPEKLCEELGIEVVP
jgi:hypothetical protein